MLYTDHSAMSYTDGDEYEVFGLYHSTTSLQSVLSSVPPGLKNTDSED
jgi:hypothetical protein